MFPSMPADHARQTMLAYPGRPIRSKSSRLRAALAAAAVVPALMTCPASADPRSDAAWIVEQSTTPEIFDAVIASLAPMLTAAMESQLRNQNVAVNDMDTFGRVVLEYIERELPPVITGRMIDLHVDFFSPQELADIVAFYRTESGQSLLRKAPQLMREQTALGQSAGAEIGRSLADSDIMATMQREGVVFSPIAD